MRNANKEDYYCIILIIIVKVTKFAILDDEHKESFESSLFRDRKPPHNSQAKISFQIIHFMKMKTDRGADQMLS